VDTQQELIRGFKVVFRGGDGLGPPPTLGEFADTLEKHFSVVELGPHFVVQEMLDDDARDLIS
jgi:hypothetical protein